MGCASSNSLTFPSSSLDYKYNVNEVWNEVDKTVDGKSNTNRKIVVNRSGWKTVRVFVSSTFKDFHAEREVLVKEIFPDLRIWCQKRRLHLVDCDLRWGIPKDTTTGETLRLCLGEIDRCYQDNVMPFFLNITSERCGWIPSFDDVPANIAHDYRWVHGLSVTEMEIMHGAYRTDNPNSLFMIRNTSFLESLPSHYKDDFVDPNPIAVHKLSLLKDRLKERLNGRVEWYDCKFDCVDEDGKLKFTGLQEQFGTPVFEFFKKRIEEQYPLQEASATDPNQIIRESHESFMKTRGELVLGRASILEQIQHYVTDVNVDYPLVVLGGPGSGKSALLARTADVAATLAAHNKIPGGGDTGWHVFYHFVGAVPGSTDLEKCLKRLLVEINAIKDSTMPKNLEATCQATCSALSLARTRPVIVIIDALNQFDDDKAGTILSWLPRKLSPQIRVIISMINETPPHKALKERGYKLKEILVNPLDINTRKEIVTEMLKKYNKKLDDEQINTLLSKEASQNPLWLSVACEELRVYGVYEKITDKINRLSDGLIELLYQVFERFKEENGGNLLVATLCLLESSQTGLLETELLHILSDENNLMPQAQDGNLKVMEDGSKSENSKYSSSLPAAKWAVVYRALRPFLRPFGDSGEGRLDFYHRVMSKAVRKKYLQEESDRRWWHKKLAEYFYESENIERKVEELPHHLIKIGDTAKLKFTLTDWRVFDLVRPRILGVRVQFDDDKAGTILSWLPRKLSPQIRVIISMINETPPHKALKERGYKLKEILVNPLDINTRKEIVTEMLKKYNKKLDDEQINTLLSKEASQNPLWLSVACEELRVYGVYEKITDKINRLSDGLIELLYQVFERFKEENGGNLLVATLCLLESSQTGLLETELLHILSDENNLMPQAQDGNLKVMEDGSKSENSKYSSSLPAAKWAVVYRALRPFLRPFGDSGEGRLDFYHRVMSKAVRKKYLQEESDRRWWHKKLAEYFYESENIERKVEELPHHLIKIGDTAKLKFTLTDWRVFDLLYNEDYSEVLMKYWREGYEEKDWQLQISNAYSEKIESDKSAMSEDMVARRYEQLSRILQHAGQYDNSFEFLQKSMELETIHLGTRPERMVELHDLAAAIYDDKFKCIFMWVMREHLPEYAVCIKHARASIKIRETLPGNRHKLKLGKTLVLLAFTLTGWMERGGDDELTAEQAREEGLECVQKAMDIFKELGENGMLAESMMKKSCLEPRGSDEALRLMLEAHELCLQAYGEISVLTAQILFNTGIHYEDVRDLKTACKYFIKWHDVVVEVYGTNHPKTKNAQDTLSQPDYKTLVVEYREKEYLEQQQHRDDID